MKKHMFLLAVSVVSGTAQALPAAAASDGRRYDTVTIATTQSSRLGAGSVEDGAVVLETIWTASDARVLDRKISGLRFRTFPEGLLMAKGQLTDADGRNLGEIWCDTRIGKPSIRAYETNCLRDADGDGELETLWMSGSAISVGSAIGGNSVLGKVGPGGLRPAPAGISATARMAIRLCVGDGRIGYRINFAAGNDPWSETPPLVDRQPCRMFMAFGAGKATILGIPVKFEHGPNGLVYQATAVIE